MSEIKELENMTKESIKDIRQCISKEWQEMDFDKKSKFKEISKTMKE